MTVSPPRSQVEFDEGQLIASLSWDKKELVLPEDMEEILYTVLIFTDDKPEGKNVYRCVTV